MQLFTSMSANCFCMRSCWALCCARDASRASCVLQLCVNLNLNTLNLRSLLRQMCETCKLGAVYKPFESCFLVPALQHHIAHHDRVVSFSLQQVHTIQT